jgi:hypothetical protein
MICPKCQHVFHEHDPMVVPGVCPACGIAWNKWLQALERQQQEPRALSEQELAAQLAPVMPRESLGERFFYYACFMPSDRHESAFWGHSVVYGVCFVWGWYFILHGIDWDILGSSFLHMVNLPFHEYGHVMFRPFGEFWMYLGGSLFQILLPLFPLGYFMVWQRDNFAASLMLWWSGQNFLDVSPYIADAPTRYLPLINGDESSHDWWNLLLMTNSMGAADALAMLCFAMGTAVIILSNVWGGFLLYVEFKGRTTHHSVQP